MPIDEPYAQIQSAFLREEFDRVIRLAPPMLADAFLEPRTVRVWLWLALSLEQLHRSPEALHELDRLKASLSTVPAEKSVEVGTESVWPEALFWEGEISRKALKMVRARLAYQRLLKDFSTSVWRTQAQFGLGLDLFHEQHYEEAARSFHAVVLASPTSPIAREALSLEGLCQIQRARFAEAMELFHQLLEQPVERPIRAQAAFYLGESLTGLRRFAEAAQAYQHAIELDPASRWAQGAYFGLGWSEFQQHHCPESLEAFERYLDAVTGAESDEPIPRTTTALAEASFAQGQCLMELGKHAEALDRFDAFQRAYPEHPLAVEVALSRAELFTHAHRFAEALTVLQALAAKRLEPAQRVQLHLRLGGVYLATGEATRAVTEFQAATESPDEEARQTALTGLADAHLALGHDEQAAGLYREAIHGWPMSPGALYATYQLGRLKLQLGKAEEAIALFQGLASRVEAFAPARRAPQTGTMVASDISLALAFAYLSNDQPALARVELERLRTHDPTSPQAARAGYYLALLLVNEGRVDEATQLCERVIERLPQSDEALEARLLLVDLVASETSPQEALVTLTHLLSQCSEVPSRHRGTLAKRLGDLARRALAYAQAIHWYETAWQELPAQRAELDYQLASCYEEAGDLPVAINRYGAITQAPWQIRGQLAAAKLMEREEQWREAMRIYQRIAEEAIPEAKIAQERLMVLGRARP